ncbi:TM2 domain-containing protein [Marinoscillum sp. 108]|jgi:TM2 domain-containing membrane protein YozV|uniref:TM2 domain-containing protein n=1 Tax=Marinoscillum luteum TaxID=861051 RepID=A0ABW7N3C3_9BACT|nr:TM2 domain-containing protein [Marinoscillum sp. 108]VXD21548.1 TM2 domain containing protein [Marinoscillum sp. 108]
MKKFLLIVFALGYSFVGLSNGKYAIDDSKVESIMEQAISIDSKVALDNPFSVAGIQEEKNVWIAVALDFFLGGLGVHRVYLGTPPGIIAGYFFTCGGIFGILPLVDLIVLVINNEDISAYVNKKGLIMFN